MSGRKSRLLAVCFASVSATTGVRSATGMSTTTGVSASASLRSATDMPAANMRCSTTGCMRRPSMISPRSVWYRARCSLAACVAPWSRRMSAASVGSPRVLSAIAVPASRDPASMSAIGRETTTAPVPASAAIDKAMAAPTVAVAPTGPWAHAQEDAIVEIAWSVEAHRGALIWCVVVVAIRADRLNTDIDHDLRVSGGRQGHDREQSRS
jgi:hypothetical protein